MKKALGSFVVVILSISIFLSNVYAYSCAVASPKATLNIVNVVFSGKVTKIEFPDNNKKLQDINPRVIITLEVKNIWKGQIGKTIVIHTHAIFPYRSNVEGLPEELLLVGSEWLVYAYFQPVSKWKNRIPENETKDQKIKQVAEANELKVLTTDICLRTTLLVDAKEDLVVLGKGRMPN